MASQGARFTAALAVGAATTVAGLFWAGLAAWIVGSYAVEYTEDGPTCYHPVLWFAVPLGVVAVVGFVALVMMGGSAARVLMTGRSIRVLLISSVTVATALGLAMVLLALAPDHSESGRCDQSAAGALRVA